MAAQPLLLDKWVSFMARWLAIGLMSGNIKAIAAQCKGKSGKSPKRRRDSERNPENRLKLLFSALLCSVESIMVRISAAAMPPARRRGALCT